MKDSVMSVAYVTDSRGIIASALHCPLDELRGILVYSFNECPIPQSYVKFLKEGSVHISRIQYIIKDELIFDDSFDFVCSFSELLNDESEPFRDFLEYQYLHFRDSLEGSDNA